MSKEEAANEYSELARDRVAFKAGWNAYESELKFAVTIFIGNAILSKHDDMNSKSQAALDRLKELLK